MNGYESVKQRRKVGIAAYDQYISFYEQNLPRAISMVLMT